MQIWLHVTNVLKGSNYLLAWSVKDDKKIPKLMLSIAIYIFLQLAKNWLKLGQFTKTQLKTLKEARPLVLLPKNGAREIAKLTIFCS